MTEANFMTCYHSFTHCCTVPTANHSILPINVQITRSIQMLCHDYKTYILVYAATTVGQILQLPATRSASLGLKWS